MKVLENYKSQHNERNSEVSKFISVKYVIPKNFKCKILVGKILTIQHPFIKFVRLFRQSFLLYSTSDKPFVTISLASKLSGAIHSKNTYVVM